MIKFDEKGYLSQFISEMFDFLCYYVITNLRTHAIYIGETRHNRKEENSNITA